MGNPYRPAKLLMSRAGIYAVIEESYLSGKAAERYTLDTDEEFRRLKRLVDRISEEVDDS